MKRKLLAVLFAIGLAGLYSFGPYQNHLARATLEKDYGFDIQNVTAAAGIDFTHQNLEPRHFQGKYERIMPWALSQSSSLAITDINSDGWYDIYFTSARADSKNKLYINNQNGTFSDQADKYGLANVNNVRRSMRAVFFDCDNDGEPEMLMAATFCPMLYKKNKSGQYVEAPLAHSQNSCSSSFAINVYDFDGDGLLDIINAGYVDFWDGVFSIPTALFYGKGGGSVRAFKNQGSCKFEVSQDFVSDDSKYFSHAIGLGDLRNNGQVDMWLSVDFNNDKILTRENNIYKVQKNLIGRALAKNSMNAEVAFINNNPIPVVFNTQVFRKGYLIGGNTMWIYEDGQFQNRSREYGIHNCGWAWGSKFVDLDNNGRLDAIVSNGYISANKQKDYMFSLTTIGSSVEEVTGDANRWPKFGDQSLSGYERDCVFYNTGKGFVDIAEKFDFDSDLLDGRGVAVIDFMNNGSPGIAVSNQNQHAYLYDVKQQNQNSWVAFQLTGTKSNRDAIGSRVTVYMRDGRQLIRELFPMNSYAAQSDPRLHFGLGESPEIEKIEVKWPNQQIQLVSINGLNQYYKITQE